MSFRLPIDYCPQKKKIFKNLYNDLELLEGETKGMYEYLFSPTTILGKDILGQWAESYTSSRKFLRDSQKLCDSLGGQEIDKECTEHMFEIWNKIKKQEHFLETGKLWRGH